MDFETLIRTIEAKKGARFFLEGLGMAANAIPMDDEDCEDAMIKLAKLSQGRIPENWNTFIKALSDQAQDIKWDNLVMTVGGEVAEKVADGFAEVGNVTLDTLKSVGTVLPLFVVGALGFFIFNKVK
ncbi:hypothetical protein [Bdellovibrio bacteriovorus]|uniref:hypothetical protein n=1 Tax=Bdellovibrio bacteriovorus TaxID=959 RepID=UPI0012DA6BCA|nr:hypothetical protein [Bdellovibrio bacteriovorus]